MIFNLTRSHFRIFLLFIIGIAVFFTTIILIVTSLILLQLRTQEVQRMIPSIQRMDIVTLRNSNQPNGIYTIVGYVVRKNECQPCSTPGVCSPCPPNSIVISANQRSIPETYTFTDNDIIIVVDDVEQFELGKKYILTVYKQGPEFILRSSTTTAE